VAALPTLAQIGRYALKRVLPSEGLGQLHEAWDPLQGRSVSVKTLQFDSNPKARALLDSLFLKEARGITGLNHPYIVNVYDAGLAVQGVYFAMERLHGASLRERLLEGWKFGPAASCQLVRRMADALTYSHAHGVLHGDVKPATVFITQRGKPKLVDFGVARVMQRSALASQGAGPQGNAGADPSTAALLLGGSPHYMAPEQLQGGKVDARSDVYSLGVVLYELLAGRLAFNGDTPEQVAIAVLTNHPAPAHLLRPGLSADLAAIASKAMARNPAERYASAAEMAQELRRWFDTFKPSVKPAPGLAAASPASSMSPASSASSTLTAPTALAASKNPAATRSARAPAPAPRHDNGAVTRPMPPYPPLPSPAPTPPAAGASALAGPAAAATAATASAPTQPASKPPTPTDMRLASAALSGPQVPDDTSLQPASAPPARAATQIRFLAGLVVLLAAVCGALLAYTALR
jgi:eukaryotic-like serine/threonine-protein kinase